MSEVNAARIKSGIISTRDGRGGLTHAGTIFMCLQSAQIVSETANGTSILEYNTWFGTIVGELYASAWRIFAPGFQIFIYRAFANINVSHDRNNILDTHRVSYPPLYLQIYSNRFSHKNITHARVLMVHQL